MERATGPSGEVDTVEEDARAVDDPRVIPAGVAEDRGRPAGLELVVELPLVGCQHRCEGRDVECLGSAVGTVAEVGSVAATALLQLAGPLRQDAMAPVAEDALPVRGEERTLEAPHDAIVLDLDVLLAHGIDGTRQYRPAGARSDHDELGPSCR